MLPEKHVDDLKELEKKLERRDRLLTGLSFLAGLSLVGPFIHEMGHVAVLAGLGCGFSFDIGFWVLGTTASVQPFCTPGNPELLVFYTLGYIATLVIGGLLALYQLETGGKKYHNYLGTGILFSILATVLYKGDISQAVNLLGYPENYSVIPTLVIFLLTSAVIGKSVSSLWNISER